MPPRWSAFATILMNLSALTHNRINVKIVPHPITLPICGFWEPLWPTLPVNIIFIIIFILFTETNKLIVLGEDSNGALYLSRNII